jgi:hypothetical protein
VKADARQALAAAHQRMAAFTERIAIDQSSGDRLGKVGVAKY